MAKNAADVAAKWARNASAAVDAYKSGIQGVTQAPGAKAAAQADTWAANVAASKAKFQRNVGAVSLATWQERAESKGATNYPTGIQAGVAAQAAFMADFLPKVQQIAANLPPRGTLEQNIARMNAQVRATAQYSYNKR